MLFFTLNTHTCKGEPNFPSAKSRSCVRARRQHDRAPLCECIGVIACICTRTQHKLNINLPIGSSGWNLLHATDSLKKVFNFFVIFSFSLSFSTFFSASWGWMERLQRSSKKCWKKLPTAAARLHFYFPFCLGPSIRWCYGVVVEASSVVIPVNSIDLACDFVFTWELHLAAAWGVDLKSWLRANIQKISQSRRMSGNRK